MSTKRMMTALAIALSATCQAQVVTVFGYALGGTVEPPAAKCPRDSWTTKHLCWLGKPFTHGAYQIGTVSIPETKLPTWASSVADVTIARRTTLHTIKVRAVLPDTGAEVTASIQSRFGAPTSRTDFGTGVSTQWKSPDLSILQLCEHGRECFVEFVSAEAQAERQADKAKMEAELSKRPASP